MAQYKRPPKKKAKGPDEFVSFFDHLVRYFMLHRWKLFIVLGLGVVFFLGYGVYLYYQNMRVKDFSSLYEAALQAPADQALTKWNKLEEQNPPKELDDIIKIQKGGILAKQKDWDRAAQSFRQASQSGAPILKYLSGWAAAVSWENAGELKKALSAYQRIQQEEENPFKDFGKLGEARILAAQGKVGPAQNILRKIVQKESPAPSAVKSAALNKLIVLQLEGIGPSSPETQESAK